MQHRVTVVDGGPTTGPELGTALAERHGDAFVVDTVPTATDALDRLGGGERIDCLVTDHRPPDPDAVELARAATDRDPDLAVLLDVGSGSESLAAEAVAAGAAGYLPATGAATLADWVAEAAREAAAARGRREQAAAMTALGEVTAGRDDSLVAAVERVLDIGRERLDMEYAGLARVEDGEYRVLAAATDGDLPMGAGAVLPLSAVYCELVIEEGRQVCFGRLSDAPDGTAGRTVDEGYGYRSYVGHPITIDGTPWGVLCFADRAERPPFEEWELDLVAALGGWLRDRLTARAHRVRLRHARDRLDGFAALVEHDLREPLSTARGAVTLAQETAVDGTGDGAGDGEDPPGRGAPADAEAAAPADVAGDGRVDGGDADPGKPLEANLEEASTALSRTERLVEDLIRLARESEDGSDAAAVDVRAVAERAWEAVEGAGTARLRTPRSVHVPADEALLRRLLVALFELCLGSHTGPEPLTVTVGALDDRPGFFVADDGTGFPGESVDRPLGAVTGPPAPDLDAGRTGGDEDGLDGIERIAAAHDWEVTGGLSADGGARVEVGTHEGIWPEAPGTN